LYVPSTESKDYSSVIAMIDPRRKLWPDDDSNADDIQGADRRDVPINKLGVFPAPGPGHRRVADVMLMAAKCAYENAAVVEDIVTEDWRVCELHGLL
jgi:hypothetical protein